MPDDYIIPIDETRAIRFVRVGEPIVSIPAAPETRNQRMQTAIDFLLSYKARFGYFPAAQSLGRFHLTPTEVAQV